jgi:hypothetical protein
LEFFAQQMMVFIYNSQCKISIDYPYWYQ